MFHTLVTEIKNASNFKNNIYIQWHGMANTSCPNSTAFISTGTGGSNIIYNDPYLPANLVKNYFFILHKSIQLNKEANHIFNPKNWTTNTPKQDFSCRLIATTNIFGRYLNGVSLKNVCNKKAFKKVRNILLTYIFQNITGHFIHIEQKMGLIESLNLWENAINNAFPLI